MYRLLITLLAVLCSPVSFGQSFLDRFIDEDDGWFDASNFLLEYPYGVMPVPIFITEPAIGEGIGVAAVYFHDLDPAWEGKEVDEVTGRAHPHSTSAAVVAGTNNDSTIFGGGHFGHYKKDTIRYEGLAGAADLNLKFYGLGGDVENSDGFKFNAEALFISQQLAFRMGKSDWFLGGEFLYTDMDSEFETGIDIPGLETADFESKNSALGLIAIYDSLSNGYTPTSGIQSEIAFQRYDENFGGDFDYNSLLLKNQVHFKVAESLALGLRLDGSFVDGDAPFYALPYIELKGIPALRYQGENVITAEAQAAWNFHPRWQVIGFAGAGQATDSSGDLGGDTETHPAYGVGFRYLAVRILGMNMGLDVAKGPEDTTVYVSFGTKF